MPFCSSWISFYILKSSLKDWTVAYDCVKNHCLWYTPLHICYVVWGPGGMLVFPPPFPLLGRRQMPRVICFDANYKLLGIQVVLFIVIPSKCLIPFEYMNSWMKDRSLYNRLQRIWVNIYGFFFRLNPFNFFLITIIIK